jgi:hypothetical protein
MVLQPLANVATDVKRSKLSRAPYIRKLSEADIVRQGFFSEEEITNVLANCPMTGCAISSTGPLVRGSEKARSLTHMGNGRRRRTPLAGRDLQESLASCDSARLKRVVNRAGLEPASR